MDILVVETAIVEVVAITLITIYVILLRVKTLEEEYYPKEDR